MPSPRWVYRLHKDLYEFFLGMSAMHCILYFPCLCLRPKRDRFHSGRACMEFSCSTTVLSSYSIRPIGALYARCTTLRRRIIIRGMTFFTVILHVYIKRPIVSPRHFPMQPVCSSTVVIVQSREAKCASIT
jgi:hypothetical protein